MDKGIRVFVGLDVHKDSIAVGVAQAAGSEAQYVCTLSHDVSKLIKLLSGYGRAGQVQVVYEAGPTVLARTLGSGSVYCIVTVR